MGDMRMSARAALASPDGFDYNARNI